MYKSKKIGKGSDNSAYSKLTKVSETVFDLECLSAVGSVMHMGMYQGDTELSEEICEKAMFYFTRTLADLTDSLNNSVDDAFSILRGGEKDA